MTTEAGQLNQKTLFICAHTYIHTHTHICTQRPQVNCTSKLHYNCPLVTKVNLEHNGTHEVKEYENGTKRKSARVQVIHRYVQKEKE